MRRSLRSHPSSETGTMIGALGAPSSATLTVTRPPDSEVLSAVPAVMIRNELVDASGASVEGLSEHPTTTSSAAKAKAAAVSATRGAEREVHSGWEDLGARMIRGLYPSVGPVECSVVGDDRVELRLRDPDRVRVAHAGRKAVLRARSSVQEPGAASRSVVLQHPNTPPFR